jgi:glycosyltransferase involved in cell wall biosynthesis
LHIERPVVWYLAAGYPRAGGIEAYVYTYATELRREGFDTRVLVFGPLPREPHRFLRGLREEGIPIDSLYDRVRGRARLAASALGVPWWLYTRLVRRRAIPIAHFGEWIRRRCATAELRRLLRRERPDVIHVKGRLHAEAWAALPPRRTVFHVATSGRRDPSWTDPEVAAFRSFVESAARVFAPGSGVADTFRREFGVARPVETIFTMVRDEVRGQRTEDGGQNIRFGILCRFSREKSIPAVLEALRQYRDRHGDVDFTFAGEGELEPEIRAAVAAHGLDHVRVAAVSAPADLLRHLDVFVHPSLSEAMPVAIVEALMWGCPCIATPVGGIPDLIRDGVEGYLVAPDSAAAIREAMERFAALSPEMRAAFRQRARARYEAVCRPETVARRVAAHYRAMIAAVGG